MKRIAVTLLFLAAAGFAQTPTFDQSLSAQSVSNPKISPDGRFVAYQVSKTNWEENAFETELWVATTAGDRRYRLTNSKKSNSAPEWSPDSKRLAFISDRDGKRQIYLIAPAGGEAIRLTNVETGVSSFDWSRDGKRIAFLAADPETKATKDRKEKYGEYSVVNGDYTMTHLWALEVPAPGEEKVAEPKRLTEGSALSVSDFSWAPDSQRIAFSAARDPDLGSRDTLDIYVLRLSDRSMKKIVDTRGPDSRPVWSPDGSRIAYQTANGSEYFFYTNTRLAIVPADGGAPRLIAQDFDEDPSLVEWAPDGIYFSGLDRTSSHLYRADPASGKVERVTPANVIASQFSFSRDFKQLAFVGSAANQFAEVYASMVKPWEAVRITYMAAQFVDFKPATREVVQWKSTDGTLIEGILIKPADYHAATKYPLLVVIHGGPTGVDRPSLSSDRTYPIEMFAAKGALVLRPNYRGSAGYGEKFRSLNVRNLGVGDYADVISGVDYLIEKGMVDRERVGAMGWSQGGYISAFITASSDRFKAVSVGAGISDWMTYYVNTDIHPFTRQYLKATPWEDPEVYRKTSPISYVKNARTPTLIQHGELDKRVPIPNGYELRQALEDRGVPVRMVVYKGFGHGIDKPKQQREVMKENWEWFSRWIWNETPKEDQGKN